MPGSDAYNSTKNQVVTVREKSVAMMVCIKVIVKLLGACHFGVTSFSLEERVYTKLCHCSSVCLAEAVVRTGPHVLLASEIFDSEESPRASRLLYSTEHSGAFLREAEPGAIAAKCRIVLTELLQAGWLTRWF